MIPGIMTPDRGPRRATVAPMIARSPVILRPDTTETSKISAARPMLAAGICTPQVSGSQSKSTDSRSRRHSSESSQCSSRRTPRSTAAAARVRPGKSLELIADLAGRHDSLGVKPGGKDRKQRQSKEKANASSKNE